MQGSHGHGKTLKKAWKVMENEEKSPKVMENLGNCEGSRSHHKHEVICISLRCIRTSLECRKLYENLILESGGKWVM